MNRRFLQGVGQARPEITPETGKHDAARWFAEADAGAGRVSCSDCGYRGGKACGAMMPNRTNSAISEFGFAGQRSLSPRKPNTPQEARASQNLAQRGNGNSLASGTSESSDFHKTCIALSARLKLCFSRRVIVDAQT